MRESFPVAFPPGLPVAHGGTPTFQFSSSIRAKDKLAAGPGGNAECRRIDFSVRAFRVTKQPV